MTHTVYSAIQAIYGAFTCGTRPNGDTYYFIADDKREDWMQELCMDAHLGNMPGDSEYDVIHAVLGALSELDQDDIEDIDSLTDALEDTLEADVYSNSLLSWLAGDLSYIGYCDAVMQECGPFDDIMSIIQAGQVEWKRAIGYEICRYLDDNFEYDTEEKDEDSEDSDETEVYFLQVNDRVKFASFYAYSRYVSFYMAKTGQKKTIINPDDTIEVSSKGKPNEIGICELEMRQGNNHFVVLSSHCHWFVKID